MIHMPGNVAKLPGMDGNAITVIQVTTEYLKRVNRVKARNYSMGVLFHVSSYDDVILYSTAALCDAGYTVV